MSLLGSYVGDALVFVRDLPVRPPQVWDRIMDPALRAEWLAGGPIEPRTGGAVRLRFDHDLLTPHDEPTPTRFATDAPYVLSGTVVEIDEPEVLAFTWPEPSASESSVWFKLQAIPHGTRLTLTHRNIGSNANTRIGFGAGWHAHLEVLADRVADRAPDPYWAHFVALEEQYASVKGAIPDS